MPAAPIAKGPYYSHYNPPMHPINKTNTTIAKSGVIIMCAVLIAAGYTVYENREQVKELVDRTRRKISHAMHTFADEIMPSEPQRQRQPMSFGGRQDGPSLRPSRANSRTRSRRNSADSITLRGDDEKAEGTSRDNYMADSALRYRPAYRGFDEAETSNSTNNKSPFDDDNRILFDAATESAQAQQHILRKSSANSDASSDTLSAMSEKGLPLSEDAPPMIPAVLPVPVPIVENDTTVAPPLPPRPVPQSPVEPTPEEEDDQSSFATSQPYWAIQQWTEEVTGADDQAESEVEAEHEDEDHSAVQSLHSGSENVSVIGSDEGSDEMDDRVDIVSDMASSIGDTDGWSEVGSTFSDADRM
ncbi:hypothetical protein ABW19_dt0205589 [Dactylella cylindrospora]|nr:hypothetical protein ABW19_dt0205589 [Dactylella cylindrospora]